MGKRGPKPKIVGITEPKVDYTRCYSILEATIMSKGPMETPDLYQTLVRHGIDLSNEQFNLVLNHCSQNGLSSFSWGYIMSNYRMVIRPHNKQDNEKIWVLTDPAKRKKQPLSLVDYASSYSQLKQEGLAGKV
jgi:hypothetical protein